MSQKRLNNLSKDIRAETLLEKGYQKYNILILAGGYGKRLRPVIKNRQKVMAPVRHKPFLEHIINHFHNSGFTRFILALGYLRHSVVTYFRNKHLPTNLVYSFENTPLDTAGAIKNAERLIKGDTFIVANGDTVINLTQISDIIDFRHQNKALMTIMATKAQNDKKRGLIIIDNQNRINQFTESANSSSQAKYSNAGLYIVDKKLFKYIPPKSKYSLEYQLLPDLTVKNERLFAFTTQYRYLDIGTPGAYSEIQTTNKLDYIF